MFSHASRCHIHTRGRRYDAFATLMEVLGARRRNPGVQPEVGTGPVLRVYCVCCVCAARAVFVLCVCCTACAVCRVCFLSCGVCVGCGTVCRATTWVQRGWTRVPHASPPAPACLLAHPPATQPACQGFCRAFAERCVASHSTPAGISRVSLTHHTTTAACRRESSMHPTSCICIDPRPAWVSPLFHTHHQTQSCWDTPARSPRLHVLAWLQMCLRGACMASGPDQGGPPVRRLCALRARRWVQGGQGVRVCGVVRVLLGRQPWWSM